MYLAPLNYDRFFKKVFSNKRKKYSKYFKWFDLAEKSRYKDNTKEDFEMYEKDKILMAVMQRLKKDKLYMDEFYFVDEADKFEFKVKLYEEIVRADATKEGMKAGLEQELELGIEKNKKETVITSYLEGLNNTLIAAITKMTIYEVEKIIEEYKATIAKK
jgi:hypothetical protein